MEYQVSTLNFFLSHTAEIFRRGILYCCINFGYQKSLERRGEYRDVPSKISCLTLPKISVREPFSVSLVSVIEKVYASEGYVTIFDFLSNSFVSQCRKFSQATLLCCVSENFR